MDLGEFLLARIGEDEAAARAAVPSPWVVDKYDDTSDPRWSIDGPIPEGEQWPEEVVAVDSDRDYNNPLGGCGTAETAEHIARHDPARVLAECEAKRRIVEHHRSNGDDWPLCVICTEVGPDAQGWPCLTLRLLALPYVDHPDYQQEWRP